MSPLKERVFRMRRVATLWGATHKCATRLVFMSAPCLPRRGFHRFYSRKRAGSPEISEESLSARMATKSISFNSAFGTVRPGPIFAMLQSGSTAAKQFTVASKSICSIAAGNHMVTRRIRRSKAHTVLHVFVEKSDRAFFTRTLSNRNVPQVCIDPTSLTDAFNANLPLAHPGRCQAPLKTLPEERVHSVLDAAAQFRLRQKANRIRNKIDVHGRDETLFQEIAIALGYKENKLPFTLLTLRLPLRSLRENVEDCEALLFGAAGFLEAPDLDIYKKSAREYVRQLWDRWWPHRDDLQRLILPAKAWHLSGTRPLNHPQRRLSALAVLVREWPRLQRASGKSSVAAANDFFQALEHPFWNFHYTLTSKASPKEMALIGESRAADILANVLFPFWAAHELKASASPSAQLWTEYAKLPVKLLNRRLETAATRLFGNGPRPERISAVRSRTNKGCSKSTKTFACRTTPIAHNARSRSK